MGSEDLSILDTPGREAYGEQQVIEIKIEQKEIPPDEQERQKSPIPQKLKGKVNMTLVKAQDLLKKDIFSKSDPYAVINFQSQTSKTKTVKNNHSPEWNHNLIIPVEDGEDIEAHIQVFNKKKLGKDDSLGFLPFNTKELYDPPIMMNRWFPLQGVMTGQVLISAEFLFDPEVKRIEKNKHKEDVPIDDFGLITNEIKNVKSQDEELTTSPK